MLYLYIEERIFIMDRNYYEILEIDKKASTEIIEKAYKTLVKKYHPDLQEGAKKQECEEKLKLINEAYEVLSNSEKRAQYNQEIEEKQNIIDETIYSDTDYPSNNSYNAEPNTNIDYNQNNYQANEDPQPIYQDIDEKVRQARQQAEYERQYNQQINDAINKAYHDAYIQDLKNRGYKIKYKKTFKDYLNGFLSIFIFCVIVFILWQIPFVKNFFINMYQENEILHYIVDLFLNIFN